MTQPVTLGAVHEQGGRLEAWCPGCGRTRVLETGPLLARLGAGIAVPAIGRRLVCSACGGRRCESRPHFPGLGVVASHRGRR